MEPSTLTGLVPIIAGVIIAGYGASKIFGHEKKEYGYLTEGVLCIIFGVMVAIPGVAMIWSGWH